MRVHVSTATNTFVPQNWGDGFETGSLTAHFGMWVTDKNADGKDDLAYRGRCGTPTPQLRYHLGGPSGPFTIACGS